MTNGGGHRNLRLQPRDIAIFRGLFESRLATLEQLAALYFDDRYDAAAKRVQLLKHAGFLTDRRLSVGERSVPYLTKRGYDQLAASGNVDGFPRLSAKQFSRRVQVRPLTVAHELQVMDVRMALTHAINASRAFTIEEFTTWPLLSRFPARHPTTARKLIVQPDGFLRVRELDTGRTHSFFLELDRSTEVQRRLAERALCYRQFYMTGGFAARCGARADQLRQHPFRVLFVLQNAERRNNTAERLMNCSPPVKSQAWLTTLPELLADPLGAIWVAPLDYHYATQGTEYEPRRRPNVRQYARRPQREQLVEKRVAKRTLLPSAHLLVNESAAPTANDDPVSGPPSIAA